MIISRGEAKRKLGLMLAEKFGECNERESKVPEDDQTVARLACVPVETVTKIKNGRGRFKRQVVSKLVKHAGLKMSDVCELTEVIFSKRDHDRGRKFSKRTVRFRASR